MDVAPIRWEDGTLVLLDQTRLPAAEVWLRCRSAEEVAEAIRRLAVRGAPAIGVAAAYGLALAADGAADARELRERVQRAGAILAATRPTAVNLAWALERGLRIAAAGGPAPAAADALLRLAHEIAGAQRESDRRIAEQGAGLLAGAQRVLTHCNTGALATGGSGTALGMVALAWRRGQIREVLVDETRPLMQGARLTAWELGRAGIPFRLIADASAASLMARGLVQRVVVGADRIAANGDVANKVGTYPLAVLARRHEIPFYVAAPRSTLDPGTRTGAEIEIEERPAEEVTGVLGQPVAPAGAPALNPAFDVTPADLVTAIVTDAGVLEPPFAQAIARVLAR